LSIDRCCNGFTLVEPLDWAREQNGPGQLTNGVRRRVFPGVTSQNLRNVMLATACASVLALGIVLSPRAVFAQAGERSLVIDSAAITESGARTLAEFLAGRVPGLGVTYVTGAPGFAPHVASRGMVEGGGSGRPALYVDGVLQRDEYFFPDGQPDEDKPAHAWNLPLDEIEQLEIILGASSGIALEQGSARGAVLVRTRLAASSRWRVDVRADGSGIANAAVVPNQRVSAGIWPNSSTTNYCTLQQQVAGCSTNGTRIASAFGGNDPYGATAGRRAAVAIGGGLLGGRARASVAQDVSGEPLAGSGFQRSDYSLRYDRTARSTTPWLSLTARQFVARGIYERNHLIRRTGQLTPFPDDPGAAAQPDVTFWRNRAMDYVTTNTSLSAAIRIPYSGRGSLSLLATQELAHRDLADSTEVLNDEVGRRLHNQRRQASSVQLTSSRVRGRVEGRRTEWHTGVIGSRTRIEAQFEGRRANNAILAQSGDSTEMRTVSAYSHWRFTWAGRRSIGAGIRSDRISLLEDTEHKPDLNKFVDVRWAFRDRRLPLVGALLRNVTVTGAYGESTDAQALQLASGTFDNPFLMWTPERVFERVAGLDAVIGDSLAELRLRVFGRNHRRGMVGSTLGDWNTVGSEIALHASRRLTDDVRWTGQVFIATAVSRYGAFVTNQFVDAGDEGAVTIIEAGRRVGNVTTVVVEYADTNGDGIISPNEMPFPASSRAFGSQLPSTTLGLSGDLHFGTRLAIGTAMEAKLGQVRANFAARDRCINNRCDARYDPRTPLAEQAAAQRIYAPVYDADFLRLRDLWLRFTPRPRGGIPVVLTLSAQNLLTLTSYPGADPETGRMQRRGLIQGERFELPLAPSVALRVDLGFRL